MELRPNKKLIDANFDGYKLSLEPIPQQTLDILVEPYQATPDDSQYSLQHAQLFGLHNHLIPDPWEPRSGYFVDALWSIQKVKLNLNTGNVQMHNNVYRIPMDVDRKSGDYNVSLLFISEKFGLIFNGSGTLSLIDTGDRYTNAHWTEICSKTLEPANRNCLIGDGRLEIKDGRKEIHCILLNVCKEEEQGHKTRLIWLQLVNDIADNWTIATFNEVKCKNLPIYCSIETKHKALLLCVDSPISCCKDTEKEKDENDQLNNYTWSQADEDVTISVQIEKNSEKNDFKVVCNEKSVKILFKNAVIFDVELYDRIQCGLTTWSLENESFQLNLIKSQDKRWPTLLESSNNAAVEETPPTEDIPGYSINNDKEDCDELPNEYSLVRIAAATNAITHKINLGINKPLFRITLRAGHPDALAIQNDVDACIWLPQISAQNPSEWQLTHEGTINAFSYIEASKQQKKFVQCSPDMAYAVICEPQRHVFFYFGQYNMAGALLKNRNGQKISIGQQKLFTIPDSDTVLGLLAENDVTILLLKKRILCLKIND